jgi:hypothetical protein
LYKETNGITNEINLTNLSSPQTPQSNAAAAAKSKFSKNKSSTQQNVKMETENSLVRKIGNKLISVNVL